MKHKDDYASRLSDTTNAIHRIVQDFEIKYDLQVPRINFIACEVTIKDGKKFTGFYLRSIPKYYTFSKSIGICVEFFKVKKDGKRSKLKKYVGIKDIQYIYQLPI